MTNTSKTSGQPQNGMQIGVIQTTGSGTTENIDVSTVAAYSGVTSIAWAMPVIKTKFPGANSTDISVTWTTTNCTIQVTKAAAISTETVEVLFVGQ